MFNQNIIINLEKNKKQKPTTTKKIFLFRDNKLLPFWYHSLQILSLGLTLSFHLCCPTFSLVNFGTSAPFSNILITSVGCSCFQTFLLSFSFEGVSSYFPWFSLSLNLKQNNDFLCKVNVVTCEMLLGLFLGESLWELLTCASWLGSFKIIFRVGEGHTCEAYLLR